MIASGIHLIIRHLRMNDSYIGKMFAALADGADPRMSSPMINHPLWLLTHIIEARFFLMRQAGVDAAPPWGDLQVDEKDLNNPDAYPPLSELRSAWAQTSGQLPTALENLSEERLASPPQTALPLEDKTLLGAISFLTHHEIYHVGQLGLWYKLLSGGEFMK